MVDVYMASLWRDAHIIKTVNSILTNAEVSIVTVSCNNYTDSQWNIVDKLIGTNNKVTLHRTNNEKGSCEKFKFINNGTSEYVAFVDDDLIYPSDYFSYLISGSKLYDDAYVSLHGRHMKRTPISNYYKDHDKVYRSLGEVASDILKIDIISTGASLFKRNSFNNLSEWYNFVTFPNMDDIYASYFANISNVPMVVLKHNIGYLYHKEINETDNYVYDRYKHNCQFQTNFINSHFDWK